MQASTIANRTLDSVAVGQGRLPWKNNMEESRESLSNYHQDLIEEKILFASVVYVSVFVSSYVPICFVASIAEA